MKEQLSPKQVAIALGVSESSLKRWCDQGLLSTVRTAGGHRRIEVNAVAEFLRSTGRRPIRPELLGLPSSVGRGELIFERAADKLVEALIAGDDEQAERVVIDLYLQRYAICDLGDRVISPAMRRVGEQWSCGELEVYVERRSCEVLLRILRHLRTIMSQPPNDGPIAVGGTLEGDQYLLPTTLVELSLRERGWQATSLGANLPIDTLCEAASDYQPRLVWLSTSYIADEEKFLAAEHRLFAAATTHQAALAVGGAAITDSIRRRLAVSGFCDSLRNLDAFAAAIMKKPITPLPEESISVATNDDDATGEAAVDEPNE
jgi:excisionase family DNA binding protein